MGVFDKVIPNINLNDKDEPVAEYAQPPYIDDMFDPLFNRDVRNYLNDKYKYPIYRTLAGFAEGLDNALVPNKSTEQWGIMGPGMGILSNFGRTMDKAGDFLIGGVTEGVNTFSKLLGNDVEVNNPLEEIFVNDEDYSGQRLLASMANSMSRMAGGTKLDESDFRGIWAIPSTGLELALDPGILGGNVARRLAPEAKTLKTNEILHSIGNKIGNDNFKGALGDVAQLMSNYDDIMTRVALDYAAPGLRPAVKHFIGQINRILGNYSAKDYIDVTLEQQDNISSPPTNTPDPEIEQNIVEPQYNKSVIEAMADMNKVNEWGYNQELAMEQIATSELNKQLTFDTIRRNHILNELNANRERKELLDFIATAIKSFDDNDLINKLNDNEIKRALMSINAKINYLNLPYDTEFTEKWQGRVNEIKKEINDLIPKVKKGLAESRIGENNDIIKILGGPDDVRTIKDSEGNDVVIKNVFENNPKYRIINTGKRPTLTEVYNDPKQSDEFIENVSKVLNGYKYSSDSTLDVNLDSYLIKNGEYNIPTLLNDLDNGVLKGNSDREMGILRNQINGLVDKVYGYRPSITLEMSTYKILQKNPELITLAVDLIDEFNSKYNMDFIREMPKSKFKFANLNELSKYVANSIDNMYGLVKPMNRLDMLNKIYDRGNLLDITTDQKYNDINLDLETFDSMPNGSEYPLVYDLEGENGLTADLVAVRENGKTKLKIKPYSDNIDILADKLGTTKDEVSNALLHNGNTPSRRVYVNKFNNNKYRLLLSKNGIRYKKSNGDIITTEQLINEIKNPTNKNLVEYYKTFTKQNVIEEYKALNLSKSIGDFITFKDGKGIIDNTKLYDFVDNRNWSSSSLNAKSYKALLKKLENLPAKQVFFDSNKVYTKDIKALENYELFVNNALADLRNLNSKFNPNLIRIINNFNNFDPLVYNDNLINYNKIVNGSSKYNMLINPNTFKNRFNNLYSGENKSKFYKDKEYLSNKANNATNIADAKYFTDELNDLNLSDEEYNTPIGKMLSSIRQFVGYTKQIEYNVPVLDEELQGYVDLGRRLEDEVLLPLQNKVRTNSIEETSGVLPQNDARLYGSPEGIENEDSFFDKEFSKENGDGAFRKSSILSYNAIPEINRILKMNPHLFRNEDGTLDVNALRLLNDSLDYIGFKIPDYEYVRIADANGKLNNSYLEAATKLRDAILANKEVVPPTIRKLDTEGMRLLRKYKDITNEIKNKEIELSRRNYKTTLEFNSNQNIVRTIDKQGKNINPYKNLSTEALAHSIDDLRKTKYDLSTKFRKDYGLKVDDYTSMITYSPPKTDLIRLKENVYRKFPKKYRTPAEDQVLRAFLGSLDVNNLPKGKTYDELLLNLNDFIEKGVVKGKDALPFITPTKYDDVRIASHDSLKKRYKEFYSGLDNKAYENLNEHTYLISNDKLTDKNKAELSKHLKEMYHKYKKAAGSQAEEYKIIETYANLKTDELFKEVLDPITYGKTVVDEVREEVLGDLGTFDKLDEKMFKTPENKVKNIGNKKEWRLFEHLDKQVAFTNKSKASEANHLKHFRQYNELNARVRKYEQTFKSPKDYKEFTSKYINYRDDVTDDIVFGKDFLNNLISSRNVAGVIIKNQAEYDKIYPQIAHNVRLINDITKHNTVKIDLVKINGSTDSFLRYYIDPNNKYVFKDLDKLSKYNFDFKDVVFHKGDKYNLTHDYDELELIFNDAQNLSNSLLDILGLPKIDGDYFKHSYLKNEENAMWLSNNIYRDLDLEKMEAINNEAFKLFNLNGALRIREQTRTFHGAVRDYNRNIAYTLPNAKLFSTNPEVILKSQFAEGVFKNSNYQIFHEMFINDNYKIKNFANSTNDLKKILFAKDVNGNLGGNVDNLEIVTPKYDDTGRLVGFRRWNKFDDKALESVLKQEDAVLIPTSILAPLDRILRKDMRMSSKVFRFINKLTLPFKYSILCNPGFLLGNISDAATKILIAQSKKYGTTLNEEATRLATSVKQIIQINNNFDTVYNKYVNACDTLNIKLSPEERIPSLVNKNKQAYSKFMKFIDEHRNLFTNKERTIVNAYIFLNRRQVTSVLGQNGEDYISSKSNIDFSDYIDPTNPIERISRGKMFYDPKSPSSWGIFMNNPIINAVMKKSEQIESLARSAAYYNDLLHHYGDEKTLFREINLYTASKKARTTLNYDSTEFGVNTLNATNSTFNSNFDYENMPDFMDMASTVIPFPTFFLKNIGYWLDIIVNNPQVLDKAIRIQQGLWSSVDEEELETDEFKAEAKGRGAIPLDVIGAPKLSKFFKGIYKPAPLNSLFGAFNLLQDPIPNIAYRMNPLFSPVTSLLQDEEDVRYRPYNTNQYQSNIKKGDEEFNTLSYMFHRLNPYDKLINNSLRIPDKISNNDLQLADISSSMFQPDF